MNPAPPIKIDRTPESKMEINSFLSNYQIIKKLSSTEFYNINIVFDKNRKENLLLKQYSSNSNNLINNYNDFFELENNNLNKCNNKYIIKLLESFKTSIFVLEYCDKTLRDIMTQKKTLKIQEIRTILIKLNEGVKHLDKNKINNILITPENIGIIENKDKNNINSYSIKLIDLLPYYELKYLFEKNKIKLKIFNYLSPENPFNYMTPGEIEDGNEYTLNTHSTSILWNIGLLIYELYFGELPIINEDKNNNIINKIYINLKKSNDDLFNDLLSKLLIIEVEKRINWDNYVNHDFFNELSVNDTCKILYEKEINQDIKEINLNSEEIDQNNLKKISSINFNFLKKFKKI